MTTDLLLRRKWTLHAHGKQVIFIKKPNEHTSHVLMKALLWALYLPAYPALKVEMSIGDRYKPDVVALDLQDSRVDPHFWGEAGQVSNEKIHSLLRRYRRTHFAIAKWATNLNPLLETVTQARHGLDRRAPFDLINFPADSAERFVDERGNIQVSYADLEWVQLD